MIKSDVRYYHHPEPFRLESGVELEGLTIAYHIFGDMSERRDNVVWVCHALTANSDVADWWPHTVVEGGFLDPSKWCVVCANIIGSHYGSTGPLSENPATGEPYYADFPAVSMRDIVRAHRLLAESLGIERVHTLVGSSVGGFQALEWACMEPARFEQMVLIATASRAMPWAVAIDETQRMAIMADSSYGERRADAAQRGLAAARAIGLLTYRGGEGYNLSQCNRPDTPAGEHRACSYQRYQGQKLVRRFNAYSYMNILNAFDTHDVGRDRGGEAQALSALKMPTIVVGITTDMIFPPSEMRELTAKIPGATYREIASAFGHDGFLVEHEQLNEILNKFMSHRYE